MCVCVKCKKKIQFLTTWGFFCINKSSLVCIEPIQILNSFQILILTCISFKIFKSTNLLFSVEIILLVEFRNFKLTKAHVVFLLFHHLSLAYPCKAQLIKIKPALPAFVLLQKRSLCACINHSYSRYTVHLRKWKDCQILWHWLHTLPVHTVWYWFVKW